MGRAAPVAARLAVRSLGARSALQSCVLPIAMSPVPPASTHSRLTALALVVPLLAGLGTGCARRVETRPPDGLDYVYPAPPTPPAPQRGRALVEAWRAVEIGDVEWAEKAYRKLLRRDPQSLSARVGLAYALMRAGNHAEARRRFDSVVASQPDYLPALVGAASLAHRDGDASRALVLLRHAAALEPDQEVVRRRLAEVKMQMVERHVAEARAALADGSEEAGLAALREALDVAPEAGGVRIELASALAARGRVPDAIAVLDEAPVPDRDVSMRLAALLTEVERFGDALTVYRRILTIAPDDRDARHLANDVRRSLELQQMPPAYRKIPKLTRISRADLAALLGKKVTALDRLEPPEAKVATDIRGSWARPYIVKVVALEIMTLYPNHTFQPRATIRKGELASAVARVLDLLEFAESNGPRITDMSRSHLFHAAAVRAVAAGLMQVTAQGGFEPWRPVSGEQAVTIIENLARLVGP